MDGANADNAEAIVCHRARTHDERGNHDRRSRDRVVPYEGMAPFGPLYTLHRTLPGHGSAS